MVRDLKAAVAYTQLQQLKEIASCIYKPSHTDAWRVLSAAVAAAIVERVEEVTSSSSNVVYTRQDIS